MTNLQLDDIPRLVQEQKLTKEEACIQVYKILYTNPGRFYLTDLSDDDRSDFLLEFFKTKIETLLETFDPTNAPFGAYVFSTIQNSKIIFIKKQISKNHNQQLFVQDSIKNYEEQMTNLMNSIYAIAESTPKYLPAKKENEIPRLVYKKLFQKIPHRITLEQSRKRKLRQGILILALKSAWYLDDSQIDKVSSICKISPEVITDSVCRLKASLINKSISRKAIEENRNRAYCFVNHYKKQLDSFENKNDPKYEIILKKLEYHKKRLAIRNESLQNGHNKIAPTNTEIAKIIGMPSRSVSFYISKFKTLDFENIDFESLSNPTTEIIN